MSEHRQSVREYLRASETLSKIEGLSDVEIQAIGEVLYRLSEQLLNVEKECTP
jgi:hypothetical protein